MNKWYIIIGLFFVLAGIGFGVYIFNSNNENHNDSSYEATKTGTNDNINNSTENSDVNSLNNNEENTVKDNEQDEEEYTSKKEIASFTTRIYTKDSERQNNLTVACKALNGTTVKNGDTFSFTNTLGKTSTSKGYEKADVFVDGDLTKAMGGGICQISTTLYNAVRKVSKLKVTEKHEHSNDVPYIEDGKDAAVSYGAYDFKFVNNTGNTIKIESKNTKNHVTIKLYELK